MDTGLHIQETNKYSDITEINDHIIDTFYSEFNPNYDKSKVLDLNSTNLVKKRKRKDLLNDEESNLKDDIWKSKSNN